MESRPARGRYVIELEQDRQPLHLEGSTRGRSSERERLPDLFVSGWWKR